MVMEALHQEDVGDGSMLCTDHPYKNSSSPGGICAFCFQEKLGKLVSSSFPAPIFPPSSSSSSPLSFRQPPPPPPPLSIKPNSSSSSSINPITRTTTTYITWTRHFHESTRVDTIRSGYGYEIRVDPVVFLMDAADFQSLCKSGRLSNAIALSVELPPTSPPLLCLCQKVVFFFTVQTCNPSFFWVMI